MLTTFQVLRLKILHPPSAETALSQYTTDNQLYSYLGVAISLMSFSNLITTFTVGATSGLESANLK